MRFYEKIFRNSFESKLAEAGLFSREFLTNSNGIMVPVYKVSAEY